MFLYKLQAMVNFNLSKEDLKRAVEKKCLMDLFGFYTLQKIFTIRLPNESTYISHVISPVEFPTVVILRMQPLFLQCRLLEEVITST